MKTQTRVNKQTPNGGAYSIVYWQDKDGNPTSQSKAIAGEVVEFDEEDRAVHRSYFRNDGAEEPAEADPIEEITKELLASRSA